jgi:transmembrane sensor
MGERLRPPLRDHLEPDDPAAALARVRSKIDARLDARRTASRTIAMLVLAAALLLAVGFAVGRGGRLGPVASLPPAAVPTAPLATLATETGTARHALDDGTVIELGPATELRTMAALPERQTFALASGTARFVVAKRPARTFRVDAGAVGIVVRGTTFRVERKGSGARVSVEEGRVEITSPEGSRVLAAGDTFAYPADDAPRPAPTEVDAASAPSATASAVPPAPWRPLAKSGDYRSAYDALGAAGIARETKAAPDVDTLLSLADIARLSGHTKDAVEPLSRVLRDYRGEPRASLAALTLGKLELDELGAPRDAARHFEEAMRIGAPSSFVEVAAARRVEAWSRAGEPAKARAAAAEYRASYPGGRYDAEVTRWASGTP